MTSTDVDVLFDRAAKRLRGVERGKMLKARKNCTLLMFSRDYKVAARWDIVHAWPLKVSGPETKAEA